MLPQVTGSTENRDTQHEPSARKENHETHTRTQKGTPRKLRQCACVRASAPALTPLSSSPAFPAIPCWGLRDGGADAADAQGLGPSDRVGGAGCPRSRLLYWEGVGTPTSRVAVLGVGDTHSTQQMSAIIQIFLIWGSVFKFPNSD